MAGPARAAQAALARDDSLRQAKASLIEQGDKAQRKLNWLLRGRLADAIRDRALLPMWFVTVLGPVPPAHRTQEWMDLATEVLGVLRRARDADDAAAEVHALVRDYAMRCFLPPRGIDEVVADLERILAVLSLNIPAVHTVATTLLLKGEHDDAFRCARDDLFAAWRAAGLTGIPGPGASP
ncbi:hypothetical protein [Streptomyces chrestomyceticus]|uniref:hypothetical protein n=1 Tax=Streptomyces chrestomyceticus TaxID=68185 RepID=UPI0035A8398C